MKTRKPFAVAGLAVIVLASCAGCGVGGRGAASPSRKTPDAAAPKAQGVAAGADAGAPAAEAPSPPAAAPRERDLLVLEGDLAGRYKFSHGTTGATFAASGDAARPGLVITFPAGEAGYPGVELKPEGGSWDLSPYGNVQFTAANVGEKAGTLAFRVDNEGDWRKAPWNTEQAYLKPGEKQTVKIIFGRQYGHKPGYELDPSKVVNILMFTDKVKEGERKFLVERIVAGGTPGEKPPVDPKDVRVRPADGYLMGPGALEVKVAAKNGTARLVAEGARRRVEAVLNIGDASVTIGPPQGLWDLTGACEVSARITNTGDAPFAPTLQAMSGGDGTRRAAAPGPLAPGESVELVSSFVAAEPLVFPPTANRLHGGPERGTGTRFQSGNVSGVTIAAGGRPASFRVEHVKATAAPTEVPGWLGRRPPVPGDWTKTLDENFDGERVDAKLWSVYGPNWWGDKGKTHWSKENVIVRGGTATIRFERKPGWHNDAEMSGHRSDFAGGYLDSYGLWRQRYGYFEARMKLPVGPGLWPAFWLMPDRGPDAGPQWKRQDTGDGGMEFDVMEHLTGWGPYRHHVAMHWDGYGKDHKSNGADVYVRPDRDGFVTSGLLWLPGKAVWYSNGSVIATWESDRISSRPMNIMFTMPVGGWANTPFDPKALPMEWVIDYVRVWQTKELASEVDGYLKTPATWPVDQK